MYRLFKVLIKWRGNVQNKTVTRDRTPCIIWTPCMAHKWQQHGSADVGFIHETECSSILVCLSQWAYSDIAHVLHVLYSLAFGFPVWIFSRLKDNTINCRDYCNLTFSTECCIVFGKKSLHVHVTDDHPPLSHWYPAFCSLTGVLLVDIWNTAGACLRVDSSFLFLLWRASTKLSEQSHTVSLES